MFSFLGTNRILGDQFPLSLFLVRENLDLTNRRCVFNQLVIDNINKTPIREELSDAITTLKVVIGEVRVFTIQ